MTLSAITSAAFSPAAQLVCYDTGKTTQSRANSKKPHKRKASGEAD